MARREIRFGSFRLDPTDERLWKDGVPIEMPPRAFGLLLHLALRPGQLATKEDLLDTLWPDAHVSDAVLKAAVSDVRRALGERVRDPQIVQTVHRRGYRFIARIEEEESVAGPPSDSPEGASELVGRSEELALLGSEWSRARRAKRRTIWVTGEAGIGKTAVVDAFARRAAREGARVLHGFARESYGEGEAYLPILEALGSLCRSDDGEDARAILESHAPSWLVQMPWLVRPEDRDRLESAVRGARRERMLREVAEAIDAIATDRPLLVLLEDLHWSDPSTLDVFAMLAQRQSPAKLLLLGTYRPIDAALVEHPVIALKRGLAARQSCSEIQLARLPLEAVATCVHRRLDGDLPPELVDLIFERTEGHPLFLVSFLASLETEGHLRRTETGWTFAEGRDERAAKLPDVLRELLDRQVGRLEGTPLLLLEAASLVGREFDSSTLASVLKREPREVEGALEGLGRTGQFVRSLGAERSDDGVVHDRYEFAHVLFQHALSDRIGAARKVDLHAKVARCLADGGHPASRLAYHYGEAGLREEALAAWERAAHQALSRWANVEAVGHFERALRVVAGRASTPERDARELGLLVAMGPALGAVVGQGSPRVAETYRKARVLCARMPEGDQLNPVLAGLFTFYVARARFVDATEVAERMCEVAARSGETLVRQSAHMMVGTAHLYRGRLRVALEELDHSIALNDTDAVYSYGYAVESLSYAFSSLASHLLGFDGETVERTRRSIERARRVGDPYTLATALQFAAVVHRWRDETDDVRACTDELVQISEEQALEIWVPVANWIGGWLDVETGDVDRGIDRMCDGLAHYGETGTEAARTEYLAATAATCLRAGFYEKGLELVSEGLLLVDGSEERFAEPELHRLHAALLEQHGRLEAAEDARTRGISLARRQGAQFWLSRFDGVREF